MAPGRAGTKPTSICALAGLAAFGVSPLSSFPRGGKPGCRQAARMGGSSAVPLGDPQSHRCRDERDCPRGRAAFGASPLSGCDRWPQAVGAGSAGLPPAWQRKHGPAGCTGLPLPGQWSQELIMPREIVPVGGDGQGGEDQRGGRKGRRPRTRSRGERSPPARCNQVGVARLGPGLSARGEDHRGATMSHGSWLKPPLASPPSGPGIGRAVGGCTAWR